MCVRLFGNLSLRWAWLTIVLLAPSRAHAEFKVGAATSNITPPIGIHMNGGTGPAVATHVHDELQARCLILENNQRQLAIIVVDNCLIDREFFDFTKSLIEKQTGISTSNILISTTHTHSAGAVTGVHRTEPDQAYRAWLPQRITDGVKRALRHLEPAQLKWSRGRVPQHVFCRRILIKPGESYENQLGTTNDLAKMNWSSPHPADADFAAPVDPEVFALYFQALDGRPLALLANYSLHYVGETQAGDLSADYFGEFCDQMAQRLCQKPQDPPCVAILSNGTSGDINNLDFRIRQPTRKPYEQIRRVAHDVVDEVLRSLESGTVVANPSIHCQNEEVVLQTRRPSPSELARAEALLRGRSTDQLNTWPEIYAREQVILSEKPPHVSVPLQVLTVGGVAIAAWPGEIFASSGLSLKKQSPIQPLFNISLANGWFGYIPPPEQFRLGAYETFRGRTSWMETNATVHLENRFLQMLNRMR